MKAKGLTTRGTPHSAKLMKNFILNKANLHAVGTGLVALDIVINIEEQRGPWLWAGGTCGNVLAILSYLGWQTHPIARLNGDSASRCVEQDLLRWGVNLDFAKTEPGARTPIIVQRISQTREGIPGHHFSWTCPNCGSWLPGYQPVLASAVKSIIPKIGKPKILFLDRVSRGALILAKACVEKGAIVFFEPSGVGEPQLFSEMIELAHIIKYSHERSRSFQGRWKEANPVLEIETLGDEGLRYRSKIIGAQTQGWERLDAYKALALRDTAGAGDWCSAGIIHKLAQKGLRGLLQIRHSQLEEGLKFGQVLAAWNCSYEGARGGLYSVDKRTFISQIESIISQNGSKISKQEIPIALLQEALECFCPKCQTKKNSKQQDSNI